MTDCLKPVVAVETIDVLDLTGFKGGFIRLRGNDTNTVCGSIYTRFFERRTRTAHTERICSVLISNLYAVPCQCRMSIYFLANSITVTKKRCNKTTNAIMFSIIGMIVSQVWLLPSLRAQV